MSSMVRKLLEFSRIYAATLGIGVGLAVGAPAGAQDNAGNDLVFSSVRLDAKATPVSGGAAPSSEAPRSLTITAAPRAASSCA